MDQNKKLKLFISYSHQDNLDESPYINQFKKHIAPLKDNGLIEEWYDREILAGEDYQSKIDSKLEEADIICLFISANFLSSPACKEEKKKALEFRKKKGIPVIPLILSRCGWLDDRDISKLLVLPTDGRPVSSFQDRDEAWHDVYIELKKIIEKEIKIRQLKITEEFKNFLQDTEMLTKAHSRKERVFLDDIFVYPELNKHDTSREYEEKISSEELLKNLLDYPKIVIAGEGQSGKTTLCKMIFKELRKKNFVPVYISSKKSQLRGIIKNKISDSFNKQYVGVNDIIEIDQERIIPMIDDFHFAKNKEKHINDLSIYAHCIIVVDDIFAINIESEELIGSFTYFEISELKPTLRYELIKKWQSLTDKEVRDNYEGIDRTTELINSILGKTIGKGIMPAYPFFILSAVFTYEASAMPLDQEITSQGYCYQAFIYFYLIKMGVRNDEIDTYINFLTELAFYFYREKKYELSSDDFTKFMKLYLEKYNLPIKQEILLKNVRLIISVDSFNNYSFRYPYLYYFFTAKYLAEHDGDNEVTEGIEKIMNNLHVDENAYIAVFVAHHSKNVKILEKVKHNASCLFDKCKSATLTKDEVKFFDEQADIIVEAILPPNNATPERERMERLKMEDDLEQSQKDVEQSEDNEEEPFERDLRRAIKTVEVMGCIIKNRAGSLERTKLEEIFEEAINVHLRVLSYFFEIIKNEDEQKALVGSISEILKKITEKSDERKRKPSDEELRKIARVIFWNLNFFVVYSVIHKIVHSVGSDKLIEISKKVCDEINTPAAFIVKHGILMWYDKNIQVNEVAQSINKKEFSEIARRAIKFMVVDYSYLHQINYQDKQRLENKLGIPSRKLLRRGYKERL